jgi:Recombination endonuclease VII
VPTRKEHAAAKALGKRRYDELLAAQGGVCAICGRAPYARKFNVDHDHRTLEVRGLLCFLCNYFTVQRTVTPELLEAAAAYLRDPPARAVLGDPASG